MRNIAASAFICVILVATLQLRAPTEHREYIATHLNSASLIVQQRVEALQKHVEALPPGSLSSLSVGIPGGAMNSAISTAVAAMLHRPPPPSPMPPPPPSGAALEPPAGIDLTRATRAALTRGCTGGHTSADGVACHSGGVEELLSHAVDGRFDQARRNPCTSSHCVPYFYLLGTFHTGVRDLYDRLLLAHPDALFVPHARRDGSYPYYFTETHMWERMLWRGCDYGACPRRRGVGAEPIALDQLPELANSTTGAAGRVFGEVAGGALTFTWSSAHSVLHFTWDKNQSKCRAPHPRTACFPAASEAQRQWEASVGGGSERQFTVPYLMRGIHGTDKIRLIGLLREPGDRMWSAYWFWPQYRRRYGKHERGFLEYTPPLRTATPPPPSAPPTPQPLLRLLPHRRVLT